MISACEDEIYREFLNKPEAHEIISSEDKATFEKWLENSRSKDRL